MTADQPVSRPVSRPVTQPVTRPGTATGRRVDGLALGAALVTTGLVAGVYYCFSCAIMPALAGMDDRVFIGVLQEINERIENPFFFASFFGAPILGAVALFRQRKARNSAVTRWVGAGFALCVAGMLVTIGGNIPLNTKLADAGDPAHIADPGRLRDDIETAWNVWNVVRTGVTTAALAAYGRAAYLLGRTRRDARGTAIRTQS